MTPPFDVIAMAASLGGLQAYREVLSGLPSYFPVPIVLTQHREEEEAGKLASLLDRHCPLPVNEASEGTILSPGVLVVPARERMHVTCDGTLKVADDSGTRRNHSGDALLESVAESYSRRAVGVVLTGRLDDAASGAQALKSRGGRVLAQEPGDAQAAGMPSAAIATGCVDLVLPLSLIAPALTALVMAPGAAEIFKVPPPPWARIIAPTRLAPADGDARARKRDNDVMSG